MASDPEIEVEEISESSSHSDDERPATPTFVESLPSPIRRRVVALKELQVESNRIEAKFYKEVFKLEKAYHEEFQAVYTKRSAIIKGEYEPTGDANSEEGEADGEGEAEIQASNETEAEASTEPEVKPEADADNERDTSSCENKDNGTEAPEDQPRGVPNFWLSIFKNVAVLQGMVQDYDEPILEKLENLSLEYLDDRMGFRLLFHFAPNDFFTNAVLTKTYEMDCGLGNADLGALEGPEIVHCKGCQVHWQDGRNVTVSEDDEKSCERDSFFNFFDPPESSTEETQEVLLLDFEVGQFLRECIIPRATLYFTKEIPELDAEEAL